MKAVDDPGSITVWLRQLADPSHESVAVLWRRFEPQLVRHIASLLDRGPRFAACEEAIANAVFQSLVRLGRQGEFAESRRDGFWQLMKTIAARKVIDHRRAEGRLRRGGNRVIQESALRDRGGQDHADWHCFPAPGFPPEVQVMAAEMLDRILEILADESRAILLLRMESYTVQEIAAAIGKSKATVERRLRFIRETLQEWLQHYDSHHPEP
jgi:RNA polymerase sigma factor (sigma-70 family)